MNDALIIWLVLGVLLAVVAVQRRRIDDLEARLDDANFVAGLWRETARYWRTEAQRSQAAVVAAREECEVSG